MKASSIRETTAEGTTIRITVRVVLLFFPASRDPSLITSILNFHSAKIAKNTTGEILLSYNALLVVVLSFRYDKKNKIYSKFALT